VTRPRLLDLYCGAGGAAMGYHRAGFEVVGVDIVDQPRYPFEFHQADAMTFSLEGFEAIHASPPCHLYSTVGKQSAKKLGTVYPDLVDPTRERLIATGAPWVIENVVGAPLRNAVTLCGSWFGLDIRRHRLFETGGFDLLLVPPCSHQWQTPRFRTLDKRRTKAVSVVAVYGTGAHTAPLSSVVGVHGHVNYTGERELREKAMDINWMSPYELTQAIPPAYTEWIGRQLLSVIGEQAA
jgi:DNA (cytosine-5)-methyltransferase 1